MKTRSAALASIFLTLLGVVGVVLGCGDGSRILTAAQAKHLFLELPYRYDFRQVPLPEGASGALAGKAITVRGTFLNFGVALGREPDGVVVPLAGNEESYGYASGGFVFTDDLQIPDKHHGWRIAPRFHTRPQLREAGKIAVAMEEKLCRAATGKPCPP